jgi:hypothetical protein
MRERELAAFADWIKRGAADPRMRALPKLDAEKRGVPARPAEVVRHARKDRVLESFTNSVWAMRFRCMSCHIEGSAESQKLVKEHGPRVAWFKKAGPEATLDYLRESKLIDLDAPEKSLLLRKPLNEAKHGGGQKFIKGDQGYKLFLAFVEDYARIARDGYADARALPAKDAGPARFGTEVWLKVADTPPAWGDQLVQIDVYAWDAKAKAWEASPIATSDRKTWGKGRLWQHSLTLLAAKGSERAAAWAKGKPSLPRGKYLVKAFIVRDGKPAPAGEAEVTSGWPEGYGRMGVVEGARFKDGR